MTFALVLCAPPATPQAGPAAATTLQALAGDFYARVGRPAWAFPTGDAAARTLAAAIDDAARDGLPRARFVPHAQIDAWLATVADPGADAGTRAAADAALTRAFLEYATVLARGWDALDDPASSARDIDVVSVLAGARDARTAAMALERLTPPHREYRDLRRALAEYRDLAARRVTWPSYPADILLKRDAGGDDAKAPEPRTSQAVAALVQRLVLSRAPAIDLTPDEGRDGHYDAALERAVRAFQRAHGLEPDGIVGPKTAAALNATPADRAWQIAANMDRWRRLPDDLGPRHIRVNIPDFSLELRDQGAVSLRMRVVAGTRAQQTPILDDTISYLVFRPYWNIPASIARAEMAPKAAGDPSYLASQNLEVLDGWSADASPLDPSDVDWDDDEFPYRLRQGPGRANALGLVKFMFPNRYHVYLHDTNAPWLFAVHDRARSHGCVRVERPAELAAALLAPQGWSLDEVRAAMHGDGTRVVTLDTRVPVYLQYFTVIVDEAGAVTFAPDVYGRDAREAFHPR